MSRHRAALELLRGDHDLTTEHGRSRERWRRVALAAVGAGGFRVVSMAGTLLTLPLVIAYAGQERYGLFAVVTTLAALLAFSDLGLGNGLMTALADAEGRGNLERAGRLVSSATALLLAVGLLLGVFAALLVPLLDWGVLLGAPPALAAESRAAVLVFSACFIVGIPASIGQKVRLGLQQGLTANLFSLGGALLSIVSTLVCIAAEASVPWLVLSTVGATSVALLADCVLLFAIRRPDLRPRWTRVSGPELRQLLSSGSLFFILGAASAVAFQTGALVVSSVLGTAAATTYVIALRLFALPTLLVSFVLMPLWPAYSEALARGDRTWLCRTLARSTAFAASVNIPLSLLLLVFGEDIVHAWVGPGVGAPVALYAGFAAWTVVNSLLAPMAMLLNGANVVGFQVASATTMAALNLLLSVLLTQRFGVAGPVLATLVATTVCSTVPYAIYVRRMLSQRS